MDKIIQQILNPQLQIKVLLFFSFSFILVNLYPVIKKIKKPALLNKIFDKFPFKKYAEAFLSFMHRIIPKSLKLKLAFNVISFLAISLSLAGLTIPIPKITNPSEPALGITQVSDKNPLLIEFNRPVDKQSLKHEITPKLEGDWVFNGEKLDIAETLIFIPKESPKLETRYTVSLNDIKNIFGTKKENYLFSFQTPPAPKVQSVNPENETNGILPNQQIEIIFDYPHENSAEFSFELNPPIPLEVKKDSDIKYILIPKEEYRKSTTYNLKIYRKLVSFNYEKNETISTEEKEEIWTSTFTSIESLGVKSYSPNTSGVLIDTSIKIEFKQDMDKFSTEEAFSLNPNIEGSFSWEHNRILTYKPNSNLSKNTKYEVTIAKSAKAVNGVSLDEDFKFNFTTIGYVTASFSPGNGAKNVDTNTKIYTYFNQSVDHASAQNNFNISPAIQGSFSWSGNTMIFSHSSFPFSQTYAVRIETGVKAIHGLDSAQAFGSTFTTKPQTIILNIPSYRQSHNYSCYAAASRMALAYKGVNVSENTILSLIGYDNSPFSGTWRDPNSIWGNPYAGIVGNVDGKSGGVNWGYGAYWGPTSNAIKNYRSTAIKSGWSVQGIAQEIANGNPVIVWWVNGVWPAYEVYWKTPGGQSIRGVNSLHVQAVKGFTGTVENPTSFIVNDSGYGYPSKTFDVGTFKAKWSWFGNTAVVVY